MLFDKALPNGESKLREVIRKPKKHGQFLFVVDQPATIDAAIIAQAARTLPHASRAIQLVDEQVAELSMLCGFDDDVLGQIVATSNRIRGLLTQIRPALEQVLGPHLDHPAVLDLLQKFPSPASMKTAGTVRLGNRLIAA